MSNEELTHLLMEAAQCAWEHVDMVSSRINGPEQRARELYGTAELRHRCRVLAPYICEIYDEYSKANGKSYTPLERAGIYAYDWDFVPFFLESCTTDNLKIHDDYKERFADALREAVDMVPEDYLPY